MLRKLVFGFLLFSGLQNTYAACTTTACTGRITMLYVDTAVVHIKMDQNMSALDCNLLGGAYIGLEPNHPSYDQIYSLLLASHMANKDNVKIRISEYGTDCKVSYVTSEW